MFQSSTLSTGAAIQQYITYIQYIMQYISIHSKHTVRAWIIVLYTVYILLSFLFPSLSTWQTMCYCTSYKPHKCAHRNTHSEHSQDFFVLLPAHSKAKGLVCHLQCVADGAGGVSVEAADVLMGDFKPLPVGIIDLRREREGRHSHTDGVSVASYLTVMFVLCCVHRFFCPLLFCTAFVLEDALIKTCF